jgi:hypothetical protein
MPLRPPMQTMAPVLPRAYAVASPIPDAPPVMSAVLARPFTADVRGSARSYRHRVPGLG